MPVGRRYKPPQSGVLPPVRRRDTRTRVALAENRDAKGDDDALQARLESLSRSLDAGRPVEAPGNRPQGRDTSLAGAMSLGFRVLTEFVAGIAVGTLIGWLLDRWLHTSPAFLIAFMALGTAAGFWNVYRLAAKPTGGGSSGGQP